MQPRPAKTAVAAGASRTNGRIGVSLCVDWPSLNDLSEVPCAGRAQGLVTSLMHAGVSFQLVAQIAIYPRDNSFREDFGLHIA
jgi:hypothetical protein